MPMEFNQLELRRETLFKDAVLTSADAKSMQIIAEAQMKSQAELAEARKSCELADHDLIAAGLRRESEREFSSAAQQARQELLEHRTRLVEDLFDQVEKRLADFTAEKGHGRWLACLASLHAEELGGAAGLKVFLRKADMAHAAEIKKALPGCEVTADHTIRLGGVKVSDGRRLFDETLDARMLAERERFTMESGLNL